MTDWKPMPGRIIVMKAPPVRMIGGLYVPESGGERPTVGIVVAADPSRKEGEEGPAVGDEVVFSAHGGFSCPALGPNIAVFFPQEIMAYRTPGMAVQYPQPGESAAFEGPPYDDGDGNEVDALDSAYPAVPVHAAFSGEIPTRLPEIDGEDGSGAGGD